MRGAKADLPVDVDQGGAVIREIAWGAMNVALESFQAGIDTAPLFRGLPDDLCQCPHWGYVVKGRVRVRYQDHEEVLTAGDVYYLEPGHTTAFEEDTELVEFSAAGAYQETIAVAARNMAAMLAG